MLPRLAQHPDRCRPRPNQIAHRLVRLIGDPNRRQLAGAMQLGQHQRIAAIRLDPVAKSRFQTFPPTPRTGEGSHLKPS